MSNINEALVREVVEQVLSRLDSLTGKSSSCCSSAKRARHFGVFQDATEACQAAQDAYKQFQTKGIAGRKTVINIVKQLTTENASQWGKIELDETHIGRLDHKIDKLLGLKNLPGVEFLKPNGMSGDHGITMEEYTPFGVIGAITPSTHSIPTLACNVIAMTAAGNAVVFNPHPGACRCAAMATRVINEAIFQALGIENLVCIIEQPTLESFQGIATNPYVKLLCVTGGPGVVKAAMKSGKRAVCAGPGNPPVLVDETADMDKATADLEEREIIEAEGGMYSSENVTNILLIGTDERSEQFSNNARGDTCMLLSLNKKAGTVKLVSFERGMGVPILDGQYKGQYDWLTHTFRYGGADLMMREIQECFKVEVNRYIRVNLSTFIDGIDAIGGIDIELTQAEADYINHPQGTYAEYHIAEMKIKDEVQQVKAGMNHLNGATAMLYARCRYIDSDWGRVKRQQKVIQAAVNQVKNLPILNKNHLRQN